MPWLLLALTRAMLEDVHVAQVGSPPATLPKAALSSGSAEIVSSIGDVVIHQLTCLCMICGYCDHYRKLVVVVEYECCLLLHEVWIGMSSFI